MNRPPSNVSPPSDRPSGRVEPSCPSSLTSRVEMAGKGGDRVRQRVSPPAAPRLGRRGLEHLARTLTERDLQILTDVGRFRLLTGLQLQHLHFGLDAAAARAARRCLKRLHEHRLLARLNRRVGGVRAGSDGYVYALGPVGDRLLDRSQPRRRVREVSDGFLDHTLAVADVYVQLVRAARDGRDLTLERLDTEPACWRRLDDNADTWLKPDLLTVLTTPANEFHSFVEVDCGSEHRPALLRKLRTYELAYRLGVVAVDAAVFPRVVWLVPDDERARLLSGLISGTTSLTPQLYAVARQEQAVAALTGGSLTAARDGQ